MAWISDKSGFELEILDQPIANGHTRRLRELILDYVEMMLIKHESKAAIEVHLRTLKHSLEIAGESKEDAKKNLVPTTIKQFTKLISYLRSETKFYIACCCACSTTETKCPICGDELWTAAGRPKALFFLRRVRPWLMKLLEGRIIRAAVESYRKRTPPAAGVLADYLDGKYIKDLIRSGTIVDRFFFFPIP